MLFVCLSIISSPRFCMEISSLFILYLRESISIPAWSSIESESTKVVFLLSFYFSNFCFRKKFPPLSPFYAGLKHWSLLKLRQIYIKGRLVLVWGSQLHCWKIHLKLKLVNLPCTSIALLDTSSWMRSTLKSKIDLLALFLIISRELLVNLLLWRVWG